MNSSLCAAARRPLIALDADGVLLDYNHAYRHAWARAFGVLPELRDPAAYWAIDRWDVRRLEGDELSALRTCFDEVYWSTMQALPGAIEACHALCAAGFELVCVSALQPRFREARHHNLRTLGFPIEQVFATSNLDNGVSPKAAALQQLQPLAFVDDYAPYLRGIPADIHAALVLREPNGSPNQGDSLALAHSTHDDLSAFAGWWLNRGEASA